MRTSIPSFISSLLLLALHVSAAHLVPRIIGGQPASKSDFGYVAYIEYYEPKSGKSFTCDGNLIAPNIVLTYITPTMSEADIHNTTQFYRVAFPYKFPDKTHPIDGHRVNQIILHPQDPNSKSALSMSLLVLADNVPSSEAVPTKVFTGPFSTSSHVKAAGYGITNPHDSGSYPAQLMETDIDLGSQDYCANSNDNFTPNNMLCSKPGNGHDTCSGDNGGPLAISSGDPSMPWPLLGIFRFKFGSTDSQGSFCAYSGSNTYYNYVKPYVDWISQETKLDPRDFTMDGKSNSKDSGSASSSSSSSTSSGSSTGSSGISSSSDGNTSSNLGTAGTDTSTNSQTSGDDSSSENSNHNSGSGSTEISGGTAAEGNKNGDTSADHSKRNTIIAAVCGSIGGLLLAVLGYFLIRWWRNHMRYVEDPAQDYTVRDMLADDLNVAGMANANKPMNTQSIVDPSANHNFNFIGVMEHDTLPLNLPPAYDSHDTRPPTRDLEANKK